MKLVKLSPLFLISLLALTPAVRAQTTDPAVPRSTTVADDNDDDSGKLGLIGLLGLLGLMGLKRRDHDNRAR